MSTRQWLWSLRLGAMALLLSFSATSAEPAKQINSDACMKCHKRNGQMLGHHGQDAMKMTCSSCHGEKGDGKGNLVVKEKFLGVPSYKDREITDGSIFHVVTYGLNSMGSHANQLSQEERWVVADYVLKLKAGL